MVEDVIAKTIQTYEETAEDYFKTRSDISVMKGTADYFIQNLNGKKILDIGCGPGRDARYFSEQGFDVTGIDLTPKFISIASQYAPKAKFINMDMRYLEFQENTFDSIWACASFLHIQKKEANSTLLGFRKVLKPNGLLYLTVKQGTDEKVVESKESNYKPKFFADYTEEELENLVESCDFNIFKLEIVQKKVTWINVFATK